MSLLRRDVDYAFRLILGRAPESAQVVEAHMRRFPDLAALRRHLLGSSEFQNGYAALADDPNQLAVDPQAEKLVFLHIPKTAGTTLAAMLETQFPPGVVFPARYRLSHYPASVLARHRFFHGHFTLREIGHIPGRLAIVTMLREPRARILSQYFYHRSRRAADRRAGRANADPGLVVARSELPLKDYLRDPEIRQNWAVRNGQTMLLCGTNEAMLRDFPVKLSPAGAPLLGQIDKPDLLEIATLTLLSLAFFGLVERFDDSARMLFAGRGLAMSGAYERRMVTPAPDEPRDEETERLLDDLVDLDEPLYRFAAGLFDERFRRFIGQPEPAPEPPPPPPPAPASGLARLRVWLGRPGG